MDLEVRLLAVESLIQHGANPDEATIKNALTKQRPGFGLTGELLHSMDGSYYEQYSQRKLSRMTYSDLQKRAEGSGVFEHLEISELYHRFTGRVIDEIRENLEDGFKRYFEMKVRQMIERLGDEAKVVKDVNDLEGYLQNRLTTKAIDALCAYEDIADLELVRRTLDRYEVGYSRSALHYLGRRGDWSDKDRILSFGRRYSSSWTLLDFSSSERVNAIAAALYAIGRARLVDLLRADIDLSIKRSLVKLISQLGIRSLSDDIVVEELNRDDDQYRKVFALKCVQSMARARVRKILDKYMSQDGHRYYNSIHWLDLGASMPRNITKQVAAFELARLA